MSRLMRNMKQRRARKGFTLIELLIVVAIIAILAAIAVPNFLEAQTRAKVARVMSDMKVVNNGIEAMYIDRGVLLVDYWDDNTADGKARMSDVFDMPWKGKDYQGGTTGLFTPLTTPIAYIQSVPVDAFCKFAPDWNGLVANDQLPPWSFMYVDYAKGSAADSGRPGAWSSLQNGEYVIFSVGPDAFSDWPLGDDMAYYDSSNGTKSKGDLVLSRITGFGRRNIK